MSERTMPRARTTPGRGRGAGAPTAGRSGRSRGSTKKEQPRAVFTEYRRSTLGKALEVTLAEYGERAVGHAVDPTAPPAAQTQALTQSERTWAKLQQELLNSFDECFREIFNERITRTMGLNATASYNILDDRRIFWLKAPIFEGGNVHINTPALTIYSIDSEAVRPPQQEDADDADDADDAYGM